MKRLTYALIASAAMGFAVAPTLAQQDSPPPSRGEGAPPGPPAGGQPRGGGRAGMPQLSPEQLKAVYEAQAKHVGKANSLNEEQTGKLVTAYQSARESQTKAIEEMRAKLQEQRRAAGEGGGEGGGDAAGGGRRGGGAGAGGAMAEEMQKALADINKSEREKLHKSLAEFLSAEQTEKVIAPLGAFDRQWDQQTAAVVDLKLDADKQDQALGITQAYAAAVLKARENPDREALREATTEARRKMMDEMKAILDEEAFGKFQRATGGAGRGQGGGAGGGEGQPRRRPPSGGGEGGGGGAAGGGGGR